MKVEPFNLRNAVAGVMVVLGLLLFNFGLAFYLPTSSGRLTICLVFSVTYLVTVVNIVMNSRFGWRHLSSYVFLLPIVLLWVFTINADLQY